MINLGGPEKGPELGEGFVEADESWRAREALRRVPALHSAAVRARDALDRARRARVGGQS